MVTGLDLDRIEATARAATPGRWHEFDGCVWTDAAECLHHGPSTVADREHVATMDPTTTLALVARVRELEARHDPCICGPWHPASDGPKEECPQHGREYGWWVECAEAKVVQLQDAEARLTAVDELHFAECDGGFEVNVCFEDRVEWPCLTHLAAHPECADDCQHVGGDR